VDDTPAQATIFMVGGTEQHNFHSRTDEDWVKFYAMAGYLFSIKATQLGTNSDLRLDLYYEQPDGTLAWVNAADYHGSGAGQGESLTVDLETGQSGLWPGVYYVRVSSADTNLFGAGSEYSLKIFIPVGGGSLVVVAVDKLNPTNAPPGSVVMVDGVQTGVLNGTNTSLLLNLAAGSHTVEVLAPAGYLPEEDPAAPNQAGNPSSYWYGNPKGMAVTDQTLGEAVFQFVPVIQAQGMVRDRNTGAFMSGAQLQFRARSGVISNLVYDGYPNNASYKTQWLSQADGSFPANVWLPAVSWDLTVTNAGYSNWVKAPLLGVLAFGSVTNVGTMWLGPAVSNGYGFPDAWLRQYGLVAGSRTRDSDGDGMSDWNEYLSGTDPTNAASVLKVSLAASPSTNAPILRWPAVAGRSYEVEGSPDLRTNAWSGVGGPWLAAWGQTTMQWTVTLGSTNRFYRIRLVTPN
jgi:hypothetical protein